MTQAIGGPAARVDDRELRRVFGCFATGIVIVTTLDDAGAPRGMTANSFTSVSLDPPLVLVCVASAAPICRALAQADGFAINILAHHQRHLSQRFATPQPDKFSGLAWHLGATGAPILPETLAHLDCRRYRDLEAGDHLVLLGKVVGFTRRQAQPLVFSQGGYTTLAPQTGGKDPLS